MTMAQCAVSLTNLVPNVLSKGAQSGFDKCDRDMNTDEPLVKG